MLEDSSGRIPAVEYLDEKAIPLMKKFNIVSNSECPSLHFDPQGQRVAFVLQSHQYAFCVDFLMMAILTGEVISHCRLHLRLSCLSSWCG